MSNQNSGDHSFLLCELAAILAMLASAPMAAAQNRPESKDPPQTKHTTTSDTKPPAHE